MNAFLSWFKLVRFASYLKRFALVTETLYMSVGAVGGFARWCSSLPTPVSPFSHDPWESRVTRRLEHEGAGAADVGQLQCWQRAELLMAALS